MNISYCFGTHAADAHPRLYEAPDFDQFVSQILDLPRARNAKDRGYVCGPLKPNGDGSVHRCKDDLLPRGWVAYDLDGGDRSEVELLLMRLGDYQGVAWTTLRYTPECPRLRIVLALDRAVDRGEGEKLAEAFIGVVGAGLHSLKWDKSTHRG